MDKLINIDWFEVYALEPMNSTLDALFFTEKGFLVVERQYGTPQYREMFTIYVDGLPAIEIRRNPYSVRSNGGIFHPNACHIRLTNVRLYQPDSLKFLNKFTFDNKYIVISISRIDICADFVRFDNGMYPAKFLHRYFHGEIAKTYSSNVSAHGKDTWEGQVYNSVKWGSNKSKAVVKLYNKSLELKESCKKSYIREYWKRNKLVEIQPFSNGVTVDTAEVLPRDFHKTVVDKPFLKPVNVWRAEISLISNRQGFVLLNSGEYLSNCIDTYDTPEKLEKVFHLLADHYLRFSYVEYKENGEKQRKDRCSRVYLFHTKNLNNTYKLVDTPSKTDSNRTDKILINRILHRLKVDRDLDPIDRLSLIETLKLLFRDRNVLDDTLENYLLNL